MMRVCWEVKQSTKVIALFLSVLLVFPLMAQDTEKKTDSTKEESSAVAEPIKGGVSYKPILDEKEGHLREPFKSPFDLEKERKEKKKSRLNLGDSSERLEYKIGELSLKGIYFQVEQGYFAIFFVAGIGEYKWYQVGTKFQDGDLVNITDNEVWFKVFVDEEDGTSEGRVREEVQELHRGEE